MLLRTPALYGSGGDDAVIRKLNPAIWMDATKRDLLTLSGSLVVNQLSRVNSLQATQATSANQPKYLSSGINGRPALEFFHAGVASSLVMNDNAVMNWSEFFMFVVFERTADSGLDESLVSKFNSAGNQREWAAALTTSDRFQGSASTNGTTTVNAQAVSSIAVGVPTLGMFWYQASDQKIYSRIINATSDVTSSGGAMASIFNGTSEIRFGTRAGGVTLPFVGKMGENAFFSYLPSLSEREAIANQTLDKWGVI